MDSQSITHPIFRIGLSLGLAALLTTTLLFLTPQMPAPTAQPMSPFSALTVYATGGLTITQAAPATVNQGDNLTYTFIVTNNTGTDLTAAQVKDLAPTNTTCQNVSEATSSAAWLVTDCNGGGPQWNLFFMDGVAGYDQKFVDGSSATFQYTVAVAAPLPDQSDIINDGVQASSTFPASFAATAVPVTTKVNAPNWVINTTVSTTTVEPEQTLNYTITVRNTGHLATSGRYTITAPLPNNVTFQSATGGVTPSGGNLVWTVDAPLAINGSQTLNFSVKVNAGVSNGTQIVSSGVEVRGGNTFAPATAPNMVTTVGFIGPPATVNLSLTKTTLNLCETTTAVAVVRDADSQLIPNTQVSIAKFFDGAGETTPSSATGLTDVTGRFTTTLQGTTAGSLHVRAVTDKLLSAEQPLLTVLSTAMPTSLGLTASAEKLIVGGDAITMTAAVRDCQSNGLAGQNVTFELSDLSLASFAGGSNPLAVSTNSSGLAIATLQPTTNRITGTLIITATMGDYQQVMQLPVLGREVITLSNKNVYVPFVKK